MKTILLIGEDRPLIQIRAAVLSRFFSANTLCHKPVELAHEWPAEALDLIVLCHSLSDATRRTMIAKIRGSGGAVRILQVESGLGQHEPSEADDVVEAEPEKLVNKVSEIFVN